MFKADSNYGLWPETVEASTFTLQLPGVPDALVFRRADGCEVACDFLGAEICNGVDDDCDDLVDDADPDLTAPANLCNVNGACANATVSCQGASGWRCQYGLAGQGEWFLAERDPPEEPAGGIGGGLPGAGPG